MEPIVYCWQCGSEAAPGASFCGRCGTALRTAPAAVAGRMMPETVMAVPAMGAGGAVATATAPVAMPAALETAPAVPGEPATRAAVRDAGFWMRLGAGMIDAVLLGITSG